MIKTLHKKVFNESLEFANERAIFWNREKMLIISDLHIGKSAHFRKNGIAIPSQVLEKDLLRLEWLIQYFSPTKLLIVGDFLHAGANSDLEIFRLWRNRFHNLEILLVKGNHDRISTKSLDNLEITIFENQLDISPFNFIHEPQIIMNQFVISGHFHPGVSLKQGKIQTLKLPCFAISNQQLILPAFSQFTGLDLKSIDHHFQKIAVHPEFIMEV